MTSEIRTLLQCIHFTFMYVRSLFCIKSVNHRPWKPNVAVVFLFVELRNH